MESTFVNLAKSETQVDSSLAETALASLKLKDESQSVEETSNLDGSTNIDSSKQLSVKVDEDESSKNSSRKKAGGISMLNFKKIDEDFLIPNDDWIRERTLGVGAYGKVMECTYEPLDVSFAVKRFE